MRSRWVGVAAAASLLAVGGLVLTLADNGTPPHREPSGAKPTPTRAAGPFYNLPSAEIARQAIADMGKLRNFRAEITVQEKHRVLHIDVRRANGGECFGQVSEGGETLIIIATVTHIFVRASAQYWRENGSHDVIQDMTRQPSKWARFDDSDAHGLCDIPALLDRLELDKKTLAGLLAKQPAPFQGYTAVVLANPDDSINIVVNADAPHYILDITYEGEVQFSDFGLPATVRVPRPGQFVPFRDASITV